MINRDASQSRYDKLCTFGVCAVTTIQEVYQYTIAYITISQGGCVEIVM